jgi:hypothetical protein
MATMFNLLRANDLVWSNVINNYLLGKEPPAFDVLYWSNDGTRVTKKAHTFFLRQFFSVSSQLRASSEPRSSPLPSSVLPPLPIGSANLFSRQPIPMWWSWRASPAGASVLAGLA